MLSDGRMTSLLKVTLYASFKTSFFTVPYHVRCDVDQFCSFPDADKLPGMEEVLRSDLSDVGMGIMMSDPVAFCYEYERASNTRITISHQGVLAIFAGSGNSVVHFTNLVDGQRNQIPFENSTLTCFYDGKAIFLTWGQAMRECDVGEVFTRHDRDRMDTLIPENLDNYTDPSVLNETRVLYLSTIRRNVFEYNVDTKKRIDLGFSCDSIANTTGIDIGVSCVFNGIRRDESYGALYPDGRNFFIPSKCEGLLFCVIPSLSTPRDLSKAMFLTQRGVCGAENGVYNNLAESVRYVGSYSIARVYKDVFLMFDGKSEQWVLVRIVVP